MTPCPVAGCDRAIAGTSLLTIPIANVGNRQALARSTTLLRRIPAIGHGDQLLSGQSARILDGQDAESADHATPRAAFCIPVLNRQGLGSARLYADPGSANVAVPGKDLSKATAFQLFDRFFVNFGLSPDRWHGKGRPGWPICLRLRERLEQIAKVRVGLRPGFFFA